jgi:uncharacterized membrane protein YkoI
MKNLLTLLATTLVLSATAQQSATTFDGKKVLLHDNGKWEYVKTESASFSSSQKNFTKSEFAKDLAKSEKNNFGIWYDSKKWKKEDGSSNEDAEFQFRLAKGDGFAMAITERIEIDLDNIKEVALGNARNAAPDIELEREEDRIVNGRKVKCLQMTGTASGIKFSYLGYYCSDESGTIQFVCFTGKSLLKSYQRDFEELLNGLVAVQTSRKE